MSRPLLPVSIRPIRSLSEAIDCARLRHRCYSTTPGLDRLPSLDPFTGYDVDEFDVCSTHLGLFSGCGLLVGTARLSGASPTATGEYFSWLAKQHASLSCARRPRLSELPLLGYLEQREGIEDFIERCRADGQEVLEAGRLAVDPAARFAFARKGLWLADLLIGGVVAVMHSGAAHTGCEQRVLISCTPEHASMYRPYGFREVPGTGPQFPPSIGAWRVCLHASAADVPAEEVCERTA